MKVILFINDGSVLNPILHSQGLPLLNFIANKNYKTIVYSREKYPIGQKEEYLNYLKDRFPKINFVHSFESKKTFKHKWYFNLFSDFRAIRHLIISEKVQLIHCRSLPPSMIGYFFKLISFGKIKLLYDNRGLRIIEEIQKGRWQDKSLKVCLLSFLEKRILNSSNSIVVVSEYFKSFLANSYKKLKLEKKISVIPNRTKINADFKMSIFEQRADIPIMVYSGSAAGWQSLEEFHKIFELAILIFKQIKILILTYHPDEFEKMFSKSVDLKRYITIKELSSGQVFSELTKCNFGILIRENNLINKVSSPLKFAEYLSAGLPVLISQGVGDTEETVKQNDVGIVIKNKNYAEALGEMKRLLEDPQVYDRCRKLAEKDYNIETSYAQYLSIYHKLLKDE